MIHRHQARWLWSLWQEEVRLGQGSLWNSQESVAVPVTMKITGSGGKEGSYQCLSSQTPAVASQESLQSLFSYHLPGRITSHRASRTTVLLLFYSHACPTSLAHLGENTGVKETQELYKRVGPNWGSSSTQLL